MNIIQSVMPYITGLYTLPWILVGFLVATLMRSIFSQEKFDANMKKIGLIVLYFFIPVLVFRIFLDTGIGLEEIHFVTFISIALVSMYVIAYVFAKSQLKKQKLTDSQKTLYLKTVFTNQGRSTAFVGGAMLAIESWKVPAAIIMAIVGIILFAIVPYILNHMNKNEQKKMEKTNSLPWFLRMYPFYFILFVIAAIILQKSVGVTTGDLGNLGTLIRFYTALTIPIALFYVGSGMHPQDLKLSELKKLLGITKVKNNIHWIWIRQIFLLTAVITPLIFAFILGFMLYIKIIPAAWFAVAVINSVLPITSTNMFLIPYGIDKKSTAHVITWSTIICVPLTVILISLFSFYFN